MGTRLGRAESRDDQGINKNRKMTQYIAFMRAINVGGRAVVKMTDVKDAFAAAGCKRVMTYIQSGNVIFEVAEEKTTAIFQRIRDNLCALIGSEPGILLRTVPEVEKVVSGLPFKDFDADPGIKQYVVFLSHKPKSKPRFPLFDHKEALEAIGMKKLEVFVLSRRKKNGFYGFPNNFIEKQLGVSATTRNWTTVSKIVEFARRLGDV